MKTLTKIFYLIIILSIALLAMPQQALAAPSAKVVLGDTYTLPSGQTLNDDLAIFGGSVLLEEGSFVTGDVILLGGTLSAAGVIGGDLTAAGGVVTLQSTAVVEGNLSTLGATVNRHQDAVVEGQIITNQDVPLRFIPGAWEDAFVIPSMASPFLNLGWFILRVVLWGLLAMLVVMFLTEPTARVARSITNQPLIAGGLGIATMLILPIVLLVLMITICLIPFSLLGFLALGVAWVYGMIAVGLELGKRLGQVFKHEWHPALAAGVGTLVLAVILDGIGTVIPCIGWIPQALVGAVGLGGVLLTRFGTREYSNEPAAAVVPVEPPPAP